MAVTVDHLGQSFTSQTEMCEHWGIRQGLFAQRLAAGWSVEDALCKSVAYRPKHEGVTDHLGKHFNTRKEMCEYWGINYRAFSTRMNRGWSLEEALTVDSGSLIHIGKVVDHKGNVFPSVKEMCRFWDIPPSRYQHRRRNGRSVEESLTAPKDNHRGEHARKECVDHLGNTFESIQAMCDYWKIRPTSYRYRLQQGCSIEEALTSDRHYMFACVDHEGTKFDSVEAMCKAWNIGLHAYSYRSYQGWDLEKILTTPTKVRESITCDHTGRNFETQAEMCKAWGISASLFRSRKRRGWDLKKILTTPYTPKGSEVTDFQGNQFPNIKEMCKHWNIPYKSYISRKHQGWSQEECLTRPVGPEGGRQKVIDPNGQSFKSYRALCKHWGINYYTFYSRMEKGMTIKEALSPSLEELAAQFKGKLTIDPKPVYVDDNGTRFYLCNRHNQEEVLSIDELKKVM